jgi:predicted acyltransferase
MWIPMNKSLWTASFALYTGGMALFFLGVLIYLIDIKKTDRVFRPFVVYGMNAITVFFLSGLLAKVMNIFKVDNQGMAVSFQNYIYITVFVPLLSNLNGSLAYALTYVMFWLLIMWILYYKKIFIKV